MGRAALGLAAFAVAAAAAGGGLAGPGPLKGPPAVIVQFGYIKALTAKGKGYEMRFDPALWLSGETANRAAVEDGAVAPGEAVPNDYYIRNPDRRLLSYRVPPDTPVTVVTVPRGQPRSTRIDMAELAAIVRGRNPRRRPLLDRRGFLGYWVSVSIDTVRSIDQQYQP